jgi:hypothetical protein
VSLCASWKKLFGALTVTVHDSGRVCPAISAPALVPKSRRAANEGQASPRSACYFSPPKAEGGACTRVAAAVASRGQAVLPGHRRSPVRQSGTAKGRN